MIECLCYGCMTVYERNYDNAPERFVFSHLDT